MRFDSFRKTIHSAAARLGAVVLSAALLAAPAPVSRGGDGQERSGGKAAEHSATTLNDQIDLAVTVYNSNIALVRDVRQLTLPSGVFQLKFMDIAATVNPATVHFRSLTEPEKLGILEYEHGTTSDVDHDVAIELRVRAGELPRPG